MPNKPKDFSESAVNLTNPAKVKTLLKKLSTEQAKLSELETELKESNGELVGKIAGHTAEITGLQLAIREAVKEHGSYQDLENERYAVEYERRSEVYELLPFKSQFPKFVELCVRETIDVQALKGQIKGKLITIKELEDAGVLEYTTNYSFYVR